VKLALKCDSVEQMGKKLKQRFERQQQRGSRSSRSCREAELHERLDQLLGLARWNSAIQARMPNAVTLVRTCGRFASVCPSV
jgi:hypothetical protein